jgi:WD40 repeat protein
MTNVSDINAHTGFIKCMTIWESKNLLLTASDKVIMLWDLISLTNVG